MATNGCIGRVELDARKALGDMVIHVTLTHKREVWFRFRLFQWIVSAAAWLLCFGAHGVAELNHKGETHGR